MQDFGVNLICVEDGIDSSKDSGKLMISVLSAVAEIERENILEITGRDGFDIHIRTKGTFNRHVRGIDRNGTVSFRKIKGCRTPDFTGCHKAVSVYLAFITEKEGK